MHSHVERGNDQALNRKIDGAHTGPFPAKAGPTKSNACSQWDRRCLCGTGFSREALDLLLILIFIAKSSDDTHRDLGAG